MLVFSLHCGLKCLIPAENDVVIAACVCMKTKRMWWAMYYNLVVDILVEK